MEVAKLATMARERATAHVQTNDTTTDAQIALEMRNVQLYYGAFRAVKNLNLAIPTQQITGLIGPSGCGKSTVLRSFNRMNELIASARVEGEVLFGGFCITPQRCKINGVV